jgi:Reverse transcriptase (RNA-dependent DNA polymerase)
MTSSRNSSIKVAVVYMDEILIFTKTREEHQKAVERVLQILKDNHLYLKPENCEGSTAFYSLTGLSMQI